MVFCKVAFRREFFFFFYGMEVKSMIRRGGITHLQKTPTTVCAGEADAQQLTSGKPRQ